MKTPQCAACVIAVVGTVLFFQSAIHVSAQDATTITTPAAAPAGSAAEVQFAPGVNDVLKLVRAKVGDDVIMAFVKNSGQTYALSADEIVNLRERGVSDRVITTLLNQQSPSSPSTPQTEQPIAVAPTLSNPESALLAADTAASVTTFIQTAPVSTVYVVPDYPVYSYPYYPYSWAWASYPAFTFGFYYAWGCNDNDDCNWKSNNNCKNNNNNWHHGNNGNNDNNWNSGNNRGRNGNSSANRSSENASRDGSQRRGESATQRANQTANPQINRDQRRSGNADSSLTAANTSSSRPNTTHNWSNRPQRNGTSESTAVASGPSQNSIAPRRANTTSQWAGNDRQNSAVASASRSSIASAPSSRTSGSQSVVNPTTVWNRPTARNQSPTYRANAPQNLSSRPSASQFAQNNVARSSAPQSFSSRSTAPASASYRAPSQSSGFRSSGGGGSSGSNRSGGSFSGGSHGGGRSRR